MAHGKEKSSRDLQIDEPAPRLDLIKENTIPYAVNLDLLSYCPTMDLVAVFTDDGHLEIWRLSGQRASKMSRPSGSAVGLHVCWKYDGNIVKVMRSNGKTELLHLETNHVVREGARLSPSGSPTTSSWTSHYIKIISAELHSKFTAQMLSSFSSEEWNKPRNDWPRHLALLDLTKSLPGLSVLPHIECKHVEAKSEWTDSFETQRDVDERLNKSFSPTKTPQFEMHLEFWDNGSMSILVGESTVCSRIKVSENGFVVRHISHPLISSHGLLLREVWKGESEKILKCSWKYQLMNFNSVHQSGEYFMLATSKYQQMLRITSYITQCVKCISSAWDNAQELPAKFINNINETLDGNNQGNIVTGLYHSAVTGDWWPAVKEWLTEELTERGRSRWSVSIASGYSMVIRVAHENLLPALDRLQIVLSRLRTLSRVDPPIPLLRIDKLIFELISTQLQILRILAHQVLIHAAKEARQFKVFSEWLQIQIPLLSAEPESIGAEEAAEKAANVDHSELLKYIEGPMTNSRLNLFLCRQNRDDFGKSNADPKESLTKLPTILKKHKGKPIQPSEDMVICAMLVQAAALQPFMTPISERISQSFEELTLMSTELSLGSPGEVECVDIIMVRSLPEDTTLTAMTFVARVPSLQPNTMLIHRIPHIERRDETGAYSNNILPHQAVSVHFDAGQDSPPIRILDLKFIDDHSIMILAQRRDSSHLLEITYNGTVDATRNLALTWTDVPFITESNKTVNPTPLRIHHPQFAARESFEHSKGVGAFVPSKIVVNGADQIRKVLVFEQDARRWRVYGLDPVEDNKSGVRF